MLGTKSLENMLSASSDAFKPNEVMDPLRIVKGQSRSSCPGQRAKARTQTWVLVSAKLTKAWEF